MNRPFVIRPYDFIIAVLIAFLLGGIAVMTVNHGLDAYVCPFWPDAGVTQNYNGNKWRAE